MKQKYLQAFSWLWNYFFRIPIPFLPAVNAKYIPQLARPMLPATGAFAGFLIYLIYLLLRYVCGNTAAILFFTLMGAFLLDYARKFRGFNLFCAWCLLRFQKRTPEDALDFSQKTDWKEKELTEQLLPFTVYLLRGILFAILAWHFSAVWIIFVLTGSFLVMAELTTLQDERTWNELIPTPESCTMQHWFIAGAILLLFGILTLHPGGAIATFLIAWALTKYAKSMHNNLDGVITFKQLDYWGYFTEMILLLAGALLASH